MTTHAFLSDEWMAEARRIREEYAEHTPGAPVEVRMNQVITKVPFGTGRINAHLDTTGGAVDLDLGHLDDADLTVTVDYETARSLFVDADPAAAMQAFMSGRIKVDGDITKLLAMQAGGLLAVGDGEAAVEVAHRLQAITA